MPLILTCPSCAGKMKIKDELAGKAVKCPKCAHVFKATGSNGTAHSAEEATKSEPAAWDKSAAKANAKAAEVETPSDTSELDAELAKTTLSAEDREKVVNEIGRREKVVWLGQPETKVRFVRDAFAGFLVGALSLGIALLIACCVGSGSMGGVGSPTVGSVALGAVIGGIPTLFVFGMFGLIFFLSRKASLGTCYVLTNKRCVVFQRGLFGGLTVASYTPNMLVQMRLSKSWVFAGAGDIIFKSERVATVTHSRGGARNSTAIVYYGFIGIQRVDEIVKLIETTLLKEQPSGEDDDD